MKGQNLKTARAWALKEMLRGPWHYGTAAWAGQFFGRWYNWAIRSRLTPVKKVAVLLKSRIGNVVHVVSYCTPKITHGVAEGLNSKIMSVKRKCCGFRNPDNFTNAIYFHCGGLELYPL